MPSAGPTPTNNSSVSTETCAPLRSRRRSRWNNEMFLKISSTSSKALRRLSARSNLPPSSEVAITPLPHNSRNSPRAKSPISPFLIEGEVCFLVVKTTESCPGGWQVSRSSEQFLLPATTGMIPRRRHRHARAAHRRTPPGMQQPGGVETWVRVGFWLVDARGRNFEISVPSSLELISTSLERGKISEQCGGGGIVIQ